MTFKRYRDRVIIGEWFEEQLNQLTEKTSCHEYIKLMEDHFKAIFRFFLEKNLLTLKEHVQLLNKLLISPNPDFILNQMLLMTNGFGNIKYQQGLIIFSERASRKNYPFKPTLLLYEEVDDYFEHIRQIAKPSSIYIFSVAKIHWISGIIQYTAEGKINLLILDSAGVVFLSTQGLFESFSKVFDTEVENMYFDPRGRLRSLGCSVFAIDDVNHLATLGRYLHPKYKGDLFAYLNDNTNAEYCSWLAPCKVRECRLPISLLRTSMDSDLNRVFASYSPDEQVRPVNKKGETPLASTRKHLVVQNQKKRNVRLEYKLSVIAKHVFVYLLSRSREEVLAEAHQFSFSGLKGLSPLVAENMLGSQFEVPITPRSRNENMANYLSYLSSNTTLFSRSNLFNYINQDSDLNFTSDDKEKIESNHKDNFIKSGFFKTINNEIINIGDWKETFFPNLESFNKFLSHLTPQDRKRVISLIGQDFIQKLIEGAADKGDAKTLSR